MRTVSSATGLHLTLSPLQTAVSPATLGRFAHAHTHTPTHKGGGHCSVLSSGCSSTAVTKFHPPASWSDSGVSLVPVQWPHNPHYFRRAPLSALCSHGYLCPLSVLVCIMLLAHILIATHPPPSGALQRQRQTAQVFPLLTRPLAPHPLLPLAVYSHFGKGLIAH